MALTPESIAATWNNGGTVQIETADDYIVFVTYLNSNQSSGTMRNAEITADLDFTDLNFVFFTGNRYSNITLDGNSHSIKNVVKKNITGIAYLYATSNDYESNIGNIVLKNIFFENCYLTRNGNFENFRRCTLNNVQVKNCRFITNGDFYGVVGCYIEGYASATTIRVGGTYTGVSALQANAQRIALLDTVTRESQGGTASAFGGGNTGIKTIFSRNRFYNFDTVIGIAVSSAMSYAAIIAENATTITPLNFSNPQNIAAYYDNTLVPNASSNTQAGLSTATLKNVSAMQTNGFDVEAI